MIGFFYAFFRWRTLFVLLGLAAVSAVIWFVGPLLRLFGNAPLADQDTRTWVILALFGIVAAVAVFRYWRARRANALMVSKLLDTEGLVSVSESQTSEELAILRERFEQAFKILKTNHLGGSGGGLMIDLPWYIVIGAPGSGKTTVLRNSGLDFPLAERVGGDVLAGVGGTRNCDWWFTDQAVFLDTAGRYTTQDSNAAIDRAAWRGFLDLIKEFRSRRPLNGVILTISLADILARSPAERAEGVTVFRSRLQELMRAFGIRLPVYLMITKLDLLPGFAEVFDKLTDAERDQLWGMTFSPADADNALSAAYDTGFQALVERVMDRIPPRLHEERDAQRRRLIFTFPQEFAAIRLLVGGFVNEVFRVNRYEMAPMLRGVFLTSSTQEGVPIDRLMATFSKAFGLPETPLPRPTTQSRPFFIRDVFSKVIFAEAGLAGVNRRLERRLALVHTGGYIGAAALTAIMGVAWFSAYTRSAAEAETVANRATLVAQTYRQNPPQTVAQALPMLQEARQIAQTYDNAGILDGLVNRLGLSSYIALGGPVHEAYDRVLLNQLLPLVMARMQAGLVSALQNGALNTQLHDQLAIYLMMGNPSRFDRPKVAAWFRADAAAVFPLEQPKRDALAAHYDALMKLLPVAQTLDAGLVSTVRGRLVQAPQASVIYNQLRQMADRNTALPSFTFAAILGNAADTAFNPPGGNGMRTVVPGFFTREGFYDGFIGKLPSVVQSQLQLDWVTGQDAASPSVAAAQGLLRKVADLYVADYVAAWQLAISRIGLTRWTSFDGLQSVLQTLVGANRPLQRILDQVKVNVTLPRQRPEPSTGATAPGADAAAAAAPGTPIAAAASTANAVANTLANAQSNATGLLFPDPWPGDQINSPFLPLLALVNGPQPPIARVEDQIGAVYAVISQIASNDDPAEAALRYQSTSQQTQALDAAAVLRTDAATKPEPIRTIMLQVANSVTGTIAGGARQRIGSLWRAEVLPACRNLVGNRYPFVREIGDEAPLKDFSDFFKPGGTLDAFAKKFPPAASGPRPAAALPGTRPPPALPNSTQQIIADGETIRAQFFAGGGADPLVRFSITPIDLDPRLARSTFQVDDKSNIFRHDPPRTVDFTWPTQLDSSVARIALRDFKSEYVIAEEKGTWALFRLLDKVGLQPTPRADTFTITVQKDDMQATFRLTAFSLVNPFTLSAVRRFSCSDGL